MSTVEAIAAFGGFLLLLLGLLVLVVRDWARDDRIPPVDPHRYPPRRRWDT